MMGDMADDYDDAGWTQWELHLTGSCDESDCPYCQQSEIHDKE
jgi:hypothetical protein